MTLLIVLSDKDEWSAVNEAESPKEPGQRECTVVAPACKTFLTSNKLPHTNKRTLTALLPFAVEDSLITEPGANHVAKGPWLPDGSATLAVVEKNWIKSTLARLKEAGLNPVRMLPEILLAPLPPGCWTLVLKKNGGFLRTGETSGINLDESDKNTPPLALRLALDEGRPKKIQLYSNEAEEPDLDSWQKQLGIEFVKAGPWDGKNFPLDCPINLLQGEFEPHVQKNWLPSLRPTLWLIAVIFCLQLTATLVDWGILAKENRDIRREMESIFKASFPDASVVVDAPLQMQRKLAEMKRSAGKPDAADFLPLLSRLQPNLSGNTLKSVDYESGRIKFGIELPSNTDALAMKKRLQSSWPEVKLESTASQANTVIAYFQIGAP